jgi:DNA methyltransferase 1-associated protein 1
MTHLLVDELNCIHRASPPPPGATAQKSTHQPVYLRSYKLFTPKPAIAPRVAQALIELGVPTSGKIAGPSVPADGRGGALGAVAGVLGIGYGAAVLTPRLVMPTRGNCTRLDALLEGVQQLAELKKTAERIEQEARVAKARLGIREGTGEPDGAMDVDEREGSVASAGSSSVGGRGPRRGRP